LVSIINEYTTTYGKAIPKTGMAFFMPNFSENALDFCVSQASSQSPSQNKIEILTQLCREKLANGIRIVVPRI